MADRGTRRGTYQEAIRRLALFSALAALCFPWPLSLRTSPLQRVAAPVAGQARPSPEAESERDHGGSGLSAPLEERVHRASEHRLRISSAKVRDRLPFFVSVRPTSVGPIRAVPDAHHVSDLHRAQIPRRGTPPPDDPLNA